MTHGPHDPERTTCDKCGEPERDDLETVTVWFHGDELWCAVCRNPELLDDYSTLRG